MDNGEKKLKRGDLLFKEGDPIDRAYMIKMGRVNLFVERGGKKIEIQKVQRNQILGAEALFASLKHATSAEADGQVTYIDIPLKALNMQLEKTPPGLKILLKSQVEELKGLKVSIKSQKLEEDPNPIPEKLIPRIFGSIALTAKHLGRNLQAIRDEEEKSKSTYQRSQETEKIVSPFEDLNSVKVSWNAMKLYTTRFFMESSRRIELGLQILAKLQYVELFYEENDDGEKELKDLIMHQPYLMESFADFYQYHLYRGALGTLLKVDKKALQIAQSLVAVSVGLEPDFRGSTVVDYKAVSEYMKNHFQVDFKAEHVSLLEAKGLFVKRMVKDEGITISFDREEFEKTSLYWSFIKEINELNDLGYVDMSSPKNTEDEVAPGLCTECKTPMTHADQKFCGQCGHKMAA